MQSESPPDKSIAAVEWPQGWSRDWGVQVMTFDRWEFLLLPQEEQSSSKHTLRTALHAGGSQHCPARGTPLLLNSTDSASLQCICHLLPNPNSNCGTCPPSSQPALETQGWYRWIQINNSAASAEDGLAGQNSGCAEKIQGELSGKRCNEHV